MEKVVQKIIENLSDEEVDSVKTTTGMAYLIVRIVDRVHKKKKLSYDDSRKLVNLVIDVIIHSFRRRNTSQELKRSIDYLENNRELVRNMINDIIRIWGAISNNCCFCLKNQKPRITKSLDHDQVPCTAL